MRYITLNKHRNSLVNSIECIQKMTRMDDLQDINTSFVHYRILYLTYMVNKYELKYYKRDYLDILYKKAH